MSIFRFLDKMESAIHHSPKFFQRSLIPRDKFLNLIETFRSSLPEEIKKAQWISKESQRILQEAKNKADKIVKDANTLSEEIISSAQEQAQKIISEDEIMLQAQTQSKEMIKLAEMEVDTLKNEARIQSNEIMISAQDYADNLRESSQKEAELTRTSTDEYANRVLTRLEKDAQQLIKVIHEARIAIAEDAPSYTPAPIPQKIEEPILSNLSDESETEQ